MYFAKLTKHCFKIYLPHLTVLTLDVYRCAPTSPFVSLIKDIEPSAGDMLIWLELGVVKCHKALLCQWYECTASTEANPSWRWPSALRTLITGAASGVIASQQ